MTDFSAGYRRLIAHYEDCLERHGDTHLGVDWPNAEDAETRYRVMLDLIREPAGVPVCLLDFGCGAGHLLDFLRRNGPESVAYQGIDASPKFIALCQRKFPGVPFVAIDFLTDRIGVNPVDYIVLNGVFTEKRDMTDREMHAYLEALLTALWPFAGRGMAFNVMSTQVDWQRDDLFHVSFDDMAGFVTERLSRHFLFRQDYGLYEYTTYVYREAGA